MPRCEMCDEWPGCAWKTDPEIICGEYRPKPMTNADRIRQMTDEKLADLLHDHSCSLCPLNFKCDGRVEVGRKKCKEYWLRWLKIPVEEGEG